MGEHLGRKASGLLCCDWINGRKWTDEWIILLRGTDGFMDLTSIVSLMLFKTSPAPKISADWLYLHHRCLLSQTHLSPFCVESRITTTTTASVFDSPVCIKSFSVSLKPLFLTCGWNVSHKHTQQQEASPTGWCSVSLLLPVIPMVSICCGSNRNFRTLQVTCFTKK